MAGTYGLLYVTLLIKETSFTCASKVKPQHGAKSKYKMYSGHFVGEDFISLNVKEKMKFP